MENMELRIIDGECSLHDVNVETADAIPASLRFDHLSDAELESLLEKELEICDCLTEWPATERY